MLQLFSNENRSTLFVDEWFTCVELSMNHPDILSLIPYENMPVPESHLPD